MIKFALKKVRQDKNLSQVEMATLLNLPQSSISAMENGKTKISQHIINTLVERLQIDEDAYWIDDENKMYSIGPTAATVAAIVSQSEKELVNELRAANEKLRSDITELKAQYASAQNKIKDQEIHEGALYKRMEGLRETIEEKQQTITDLKDEILRMKDELHRLEILLVRNNIEF